MLLVLITQNKGGGSLEALGVTLAIIGLLYLMYSIIFRKKTTFYFKNIKVLKDKKTKYLKLQLYFAILNSLILIVIGSIIIIHNLKSPLVFLVPILFHIVNIIMKKLSNRKGYIEF